MDWNEVEGNWKQLEGKIKENWSKLTDNDMGIILGKKDQLIGRIQERYGYEKDMAERAITDFLRDLRHPDQKE